MLQQESRCCREWRGRCRSSPLQPVKYVLEGGTGIGVQGSAPVHQALHAGKQHSRVMSELGVRGREQKGDGQQHGG